MNARAALFLAASSAAAAPAAGEGRWATVPANPAAALGPAVVVAPVPDETWITLVGARPAFPAAAAVKPVVAVGLPLPAAGAPTSPEPEPVPAEARWPDAAGKIVEPAGGGAAAVERNPWVPLSGGRPAHTEEFHYGGFIAGGAGGPVALVNGRSVRRGDRVGGFTVERVLRAAVVLARAGALYAIPPRIPTTIVVRSA